jgi:hypothetical protein
MFSSPKNILALFALVLAPGCTIGLPRGPIEPSVTADCLNFLNAGRSAESRAPRVADAQPVRQQPRKLAKKQPAKQQVPAAPQPVEHQTVQYEGEGEFQQEIRPDDLAFDSPPSAGPPLNHCVTPAGHCLAPAPSFDPGPPGRFLPVPVRPAFSPRGPDFGCY